MKCRALKVLLLILVSVSLFPGCGKDEQAAGVPIAAAPAKPATPTTPVNQPINAASLSTFEGFKTAINANKFATFATTVTVARFQYQVCTQNTDSFLKIFQYSTTSCNGSIVRSYESGVLKVDDVVVESSVKLNEIIQIVNGASGSIGTMGMMPNLVFSNTQQPYRKATADGKKYEIISNGVYYIIDLGLPLIANPVNKVNLYNGGDNYQMLPLLNGATGQLVQQI